MIRKLNSADHHVVFSFLRQEPSLNLLLSVILKRLDMNKSFKSCGATLMRMASCELYCCDFMIRIFHMLQGSLI